VEKGPVALLTQEKERKKEGKKNKKEKERKMRWEKRWKKKQKIKRKEKKEKEKGYYGYFTISSTGRNCFAKRFSKTDPASPSNLLHQHNHN
jgi:hypothetical protein